MKEVISLVSIIAISITATSRLLYFWWEEFAHLVNAHGLYPYLAGSSHGRIEDSFTSTATSYTTANKLNVQTDG